ncbi:hypothetical protein HanRHA438_Chr02g0050011 [Helianthus annuus]|nr:hypothetical protein HanIR_Chr02g0054581 [Helianthus annuus]KAJ0617521.1 hypothetical protein HanHA89_Chr02g0042771 [Helianthus annuus]KAJ0638538.1 hypothetical protein HanHA300_Chr00c0099g0709621 [Helianthus annuus]KAJ0776061.1 hypothetical protein HanLR1_Chr02g0041331 [Helianthus annuus]KAJ0938453.1 hypothetical protein HanRHA438_Chr02g0050011 [Helianthus annuus]
MDRQPFVPYTNTEIKTRNEPKNLCWALQGLTDAQISDIRDMGFESLKSFSIPDIPRRLAYWLLVNYDYKRNELNVGNRIIKVTPSKVHDVFGVPMGKITVSEKRRLSKKDAIREEILHEGVQTSRAARELLEIGSRKSSKRAEPYRARALSSLSIK